MTDQIRAESGGDSLDLGHQQRAKWTTAYVNNLPDSAFLYVEDGGSKDSEGKTTPRSLRHFPYKDADGNVDLPHLRNALARIPQSDLPADVKAALTKKAQKILAEQSKARAVSSDDLGAMMCANCGHPMDDHDGDEGGCGVDGCDCPSYQARNAAGLVELRFLAAPLLNVEVRDTEGNGDGTWTMSGYAAVFDRQTTLYDGRFSKLTEDIHPAAFDEVLRSQGLRSPEGVVHFNFGHDMNRAVAATDVPPGQPGWLDLRADSRGLYYLAKVSKDDPDGIAMAVKMRDGVLRQASFAFTIAAADDSDSEAADGRMVSHRRITRVGRLFDVCATAQGAYPQTVSQLRTYAAAIGQLEQQLEGHARQPVDGGGEIAVSLDERGGVRRRLSAKVVRGVEHHTKRGKA